MRCYGCERRAPSKTPRRWPQLPRQPCLRPQPRLRTLHSRLRSPPLRRRLPLPRPHPLLRLPLWRRRRSRRRPSPSPSRPSPTQRSRFCALRSLRPSGAARSCTRGRWRTCARGATRPSSPTPLSRQQSRWRPTSGSGASSSRQPSRAAMRRVCTSRRCGGGSGTARTRQGSACATPTPPSSPPARHRSRRRCSMSKTRPSLPRGRAPSSPSRQAAGANCSSTAPATCSSSRCRRRPTRRRSARLAPTHSWQRSCGRRSCYSWSSTSSRRGRWVLLLLTLLLR
mmetsp:Transcript_8946/g.28298  ORF Transcript_8946/g.28298 Transcript_8946/m.28298 type:complete len:283 (+) Transcript_8946:100-948(+)